MGEQTKLTNRLAGEIAKTYQVYAEVLARVLRPFATLKAKPGAERLARAKVREIVRRLDVLAVRWARSAVEQAYLMKRKEAAAAARRGGNLETAANIDPESAIKKRANMAAEEFVKANATIENTVGDFLDTYAKAFGAVKVAEMKESGGEQTQFMSAAMGREMERKVKYYLARGYSEGAISKKLRDYLESMLNGKDFIKVGERFYGIKEFAELTARIELHDTYVDATLDECKKWDNDLVQFSRHDEPCDTCGPLEGMVFSISGTDDDFPALDNPVEVEVKGKTVMVDPKNPHPNCEHNLNPVTRAILEAAGEL